MIKRHSLKIEKFAFITLSNKLDLYNINLNEIFMGGDRISKLQNCIFSKNFKIVEKIKNLNLKIDKKIICQFVIIYKNINIYQAIYYYFSLLL